MFGKFRSRIDEKLEAASKKVEGSSLQERMVALEYERQKRQMDLANQQTRLMQGNAGFPGGTTVAGGGTWSVVTPPVYTGLGGTTYSVTENHHPQHVLDLLQSASVMTDCIERQDFATAHHIAQRLVETLAKHKINPDNLPMPEFSLDDLARADKLIEGYKRECPED